MQNMYCKKYLFLVIDTTPPSDNPLRCQKYLFEAIYRIIMNIDDKIRDEKLQYDINRVAARLSLLSSGEIAKNE